MPTHFELYRQKALAVLYLVARYYAAFTLLLYGFAKVMGAQFTVLDSQLATPLGDVSGFWLTWYSCSPAEVKGMSDRTKDADAEILNHQRTTTSIGKV